jgi:ACS family hexuronate transporter-like MFS transporter
MNSNRPSWRRPIAPWNWWVVIMLLLATVVNYLDRQTLGSTSSWIKAEFHLKEEGYGTLEKWFGLSYAVFMIVAGFLADRWDLRWLYAGALLVWSAAGFATGLVTTLLELQICRAILGAAEAFNWPCAVGVVRRIIPKESQGFANGVFNSGMTFGAVLTPLLVILMLGPGGQGWRGLFMVVGASGSIWALLWYFGVRGPRGQEIAQPPAPEVGESPVPFVEVLGTRKFWITCLVGIVVNISWHFYRVWLPRHLEVDLGFDPQKTLQLLLMAYYLVADLGSIATGYLARRLAGPHRSVERARKIVVLLAALLCLVATPAVFRPGRAIMVPLYCLVGAGIMGVFAMFYAFVQDIAPGHTAKCLGLIGSSVWFINSGLHPLVGHFADTHSPAMGKFAPMILVAGALPLAGALFALTWPEGQAVPKEPRLGDLSPAAESES